MHFEILIEDSSGKVALDILLPKILGIGDESNTFKVRSYKGVGRIPQGLKNVSDPQKRILLDQLPRLVQGFGKTFARYPSNYPAVVIVVCDLDNRCLHEFRKELLGCVNECSVKPHIYFCIAIEEGEAWLLGDICAIKSAYPKAKEAPLEDYKNDSICGTWEKLADAIHSGGSQRLKQSGWQVVGKEKTTWARKICPYMDVDANESPSFCYFRDKLRNLASTETSKNS
ncbi:MAG: hypothetical protein AAGG51_19645 [Cyanobacteria bacterium P01_G01_bin.54]